MVIWRWVRQIKIETSQKTGETDAVFDQIIRYFLDFGTSERKLNSLPIKKLDGIYPIAYPPPNSASFKIAIILMLSSIEPSFMRHIYLPSFTIGLKI
jgi:hypothetical protein